MTVEQITNEDAVDEGSRGGHARHPVVQRSLSLLRLLLVLAVAGAVAYAVIRDWSSVRMTLRDLSLKSLIVSLLAAMAALLATVQVWRQLLAATGHPLGGAHAARVYLGGQLARYLPGSVWAFLAQAQLAQRHEIPRMRSIVAVLLTVTVTTATGLSISVFAVPSLTHRWGAVAWVLVAAPLSLVALVPRVLTRIGNSILRLLRRPGLSAPLAPGNVYRAVCWSLLGWLLSGVQLWALVHHAAHVSGADFPLATAAFALAVCAGFAAFVLPSGVGVREAVIVAGLTSVTSSGVALGLALVSRLLCAVADVLMAAAAVGVARLVDRSSTRG